MTWPERSRLHIRTKAVIAVIDDVTDAPPAMLPDMRLQELVASGTSDVDTRLRRTLSGAALFDRHTVVNGTDRTTEHYRLLVRGDAIHRADRPGGYDFTVGPQPDRWPVRVRVRLLPGPAYSYQPRLPVVHGQVFEERPDRPVVADAVISASQDGGATVVARCGADDRGSFSLGLAAWAAGRRTTISARAPGGAVGAWRALRPSDFERPVILTVRP